MSQKSTTSRFSQLSQAASSSLLTGTLKKVASSTLGSGSQSNASADTSIHDRHLNKTRTAEVNLSAFAFLFSEMVQYSQKRIKGIPELETRLGALGYRVGVRVSELTFWRDPKMAGKREIRLLQMLLFINTNVWKSVFGKPADSLERSTDNADEYMITDNELMVNKFISVPKDFSQLNCGAFVAGLVEAVLEGSQFNARVTAHSTPVPGLPLRTTILIKFDPFVMEREALHGGE